MEARRQIDVTPQVRKDIRRVFQCSRVAVWRALSYENDTDMSRRIRKFAMQKGGVELSTLPTVETIHDHEGFMRQYFANGIMLEVDKKTGTVVVYDKDGKSRLTQVGATIAELEGLQELAKNM